MHNPRSIVVVVHFNPCHYQKPVENFYKFLEVLPKDVKNDLVVAELSFDGAYELEFDNKIELSTGSILWQKEAMINAVFEQVKDEYELFFWLDQDLISTNPDWYLEAKLALANNLSTVQCFSRITNLDENGNPFEASKIAAVYGAEEKGMPLGAPGAMWGARVQYLKDLGGLYDRAIVGGGDRIFCAAARGDKRIFTAELPPSYKTHINMYFKKARQIEQNGCGYIKNDIFHLFHGTRQNRQYNTRYKLLVTNNYSPLRDLEYTEERTLQFKIPNSPLAKVVENYFLERKEDG